MDLAYSWWSYFLIPWIAGAIGYVTNVLALHMTFYPFEFWGIPIYRKKNEPWGIIGWQGIIPTKAEKMANICFELFTKRIFNIREVFLRLDPNRFAEVMEDSVLLMFDKIILEVGMEHAPHMWSSLPKAVRDDVVVTAYQECGRFLRDFMKDLQEHINDVVDIKDMTVSACVANKPLIVKIFLDCGDREFVFIRRSGLYFGFPFGILQMAIWMIYPKSWTLPVAGFLVGWFTNYLALKVIFRPLEPKKFLCWTIQGIFIKRQKEVSAVFSQIMVTEIIHVKAMWEAIFSGPMSSNFYAMLRAHTLVFSDKLVAEIKPLAIAAMGAENFARMKEDIAQKVIDNLPSVIDSSYEYIQEALDMENSIRTNMQSLSRSDFEGVLHPAFEEDEIILIALGGILGALIGVLQIFTMFG